MYITALQQYLWMKTIETQRKSIWKISIRHAQPAALASQVNKTVNKININFRYSKSSKFVVVSNNFLFY